MKRAKWTRLEGSYCWSYAKSLMRGSERLYHNFDHVLALYERAELLGFEYDESLDYAILFHDVHYGAARLGNASNELLSIVEAITAMTCACVSTEIILEAAHHIEKTIRHSFEGDNRIVILDLFGFAGTHEEIAIDNNSVLSEAKILYHEVDADTIRMKNRQFLWGLYERLDAELREQLVDKRVFCSAIVNGLGNYLEATE